MRKGDLIFFALLAGITAFLFIPETHEAFIRFSSRYPLVSGFIKFATLATMGELLAGRLSVGVWSCPKGVHLKAVVWGFLGMVITLIFSIYAAGVTSLLTAGLLPGQGNDFAFAFFTSSIMNLSFAPTMMGFHRVTDTLIELRYTDRDSAHIRNAVESIDWSGFFSFVIGKTIPLFWIPAHTLTFMLPAEYRVLAAAVLSLALGIILSAARKRHAD